MSTIIPNIFSINGVIDTDRTVLQNLETLCSASGCWLSYDIAQGKWAVVINKDGTSVASFNDSNILGGITISNTGLSELYNSAEIEFPHKDIKDRIDFINLSIDPNLRNPNEIDNVLKIQLDCVNDPIQAAYIAARELKQSRIDKVIQFRVDYSYLGLKAGELITVTNTPLGFTNKIFRIVKIEEEDDDDGVLSLSITGLEYDPDVYSTVGLAREDRFIDNGIIPEEKNEAIQTSNDQDTGINLERLLLSNVIAGGLNALLGGASRLFENVTSRDPETGKVTSSTKSKINEGLLFPKFEIVGPSQVCEGDILQLSITVDSCVEDGSKLPYTITGTVNQEDIGVPLEGEITFNNKTAIINIPILTNGTEGDETLIFNVYCSNKTITIKDHYLDTPVYTLTANLNPISECEELVVTLSATNTQNGVEIPFTISGIQEADISEMEGAGANGKLNGSFVAEWCNASATKTIKFNKDSDIGTETLTLSLNNGGAAISISLTNGAQINVNASPGTIIEGQSSVITVTSTSIEDGVSIPYTISSNASGRVLTPLTGNITINSGSANLTITTQDDGIAQGSDATITVSFGPVSGYGSCSVGSTQIIIQDNDTPTPDFTCEYIEVPAVWCGLYDGATGELKEITVKKTVFVPKAQPGNPSVFVPTALTVTRGNPSTISVATSVQVDLSSEMGGSDIKLLTSFESVAAFNRIIKGVSTTVRGYW